MRRMMRSLGAMTAVLVAAACGSEGLVGMDGTSGGGGDEPIVQTGQEVSVDLRMRGLPGHDFGSVLLSVADLMVTAPDGTRLPVELVSDPMDLGQGDHAWRIGRVLLPEGLDRVQVSIRFDGHGGFENGSFTGDIETFGPEIAYEASAALMAETGKAVVDLDLGRSLIEVGDTWAVLPHIEVRY